MDKFTYFDQILVLVAGAQKASATYITKILKVNLENGVNTLTLSNFLEPNTKYIIKWDFDLRGQTINIPKNCIIEFDGGSIKNGTINCDDTIIITYQDLDTILKNAQLTGNYKLNSLGGPNLIILSEDEYNELEEYDDNTVYFIKDNNDESKGITLYSGEVMRTLLENAIDNKIDKEGNTVVVTYPQDFIVQTDLNSDSAKEPLKNVKYEVRDSQGAKLFEFWAVVLLWLERPPQYTVTFNTNGGNNISSLTVEAGTTITLPAPTRNGYIFEGWYSNVELTGNKLTGSYTVTANITLYANWVLGNKYLLSTSIPSTIPTFNSSSSNIITLSNLVGWNNWKGLENLYILVPTLAGKTTISDYIDILDQFNQSIIGDFELVPSSLSEVIIIKQAGFSPLDESDKNGKLILK